MQEWKPRVQKLKITAPSGESYELRLPTIDENEQLVAELELQGASKSLSVYVSFFEKLGLPSGVARSFDVDNFLDLVTFVMNPKKNSQS